MLKLKFDGKVRDDEVLGRLLKSASWISRVQSKMSERYRAQNEPCLMTTKFDTLAVFGCITTQGETRIEPTSVWGFSARLKLYQADFVFAVKGEVSRGVDGLIERVASAAILVVAQVAVIMKKSMREQARSFAEGTTVHFPVRPELLR